MLIQQRPRVCVVSAQNIIFVIQKIIMIMIPGTALGIWLLSLVFSMVWVYHQQSWKSLKVPMLSFSADINFILNKLQDDDYLPLSLLIIWWMVTLLSFSPQTGSQRGYSGVFVLNLLSFVARTKAFAHPRSSLSTIWAQIETHLQVTLKTA